MILTRKAAFMTALSVVVALGLGSSARAVTIEVDANTSTGFTVSSTDLINGTLPAVSGNIGAEEGVTDPSGTGAPLTNGAFGTPGLSPANAGEVVAGHNGVTLDYSIGG